MEEQPGSWLLWSFTSGDLILKEASWVANSVTGASAYLHGVDYNIEEFRRELGRAVEYIKVKRAQEAA